MDIRRLPIGTQSLDKLRENGCVYVGKTIREVVLVFSSGKKGLVA